MDKSYPKKVFQPNIRVAVAFHILDMLNVCPRLEIRLYPTFEPEFCF